MAENEPSAVDLVTMTEIARRVVERRYAPSMTRQRVAQLAETDPAWPVPMAEWKRIGRYWQIPWDNRLEEYFATRDRASGPKGWQPSS